MTLGLNKNNLFDLTLEDSADAITDVAEALTSYQNAQTVHETMTAYAVLVESIQQLKSWHPDLNPDTGDIEKS